jgi:hypothetical protein
LLKLAALEGTTVVETAHKIICGGEQLFERVAVEGEEIQQQDPAQVVTVRGQEDSEPTHGGPNLERPRAKRDSIDQQGAQPTQHSNNPAIQVACLKMIIISLSALLTTH